MATFKYRSFQAITYSFQITLKADQEKNKVVLPELTEQYKKIEELFTKLSQSTLSELQKSKIATVVVLAVKDNSENNVKKSLLFANADKIVGVNEVNKPDKNEIEMLASILKKYVTPAPKSTFKFGQVEELNNKAEALMKKVEQEHQASPIKINKQNREEQFKHHRSTSSKLKVLTAEPSKEKLIDETREKLTEVDQKIEEIEKKNNKEEQERALLTELLKTRSTLKRVEGELSDPKESKDEQLMRMLSDKQRSKVITGAWLRTKEIIKAKEYGGWWEYASFVGVSADNSTLYKGIDDVIGDTPENRLDPVAKKEALAAYNQFISMVEELKKFDQTKLRKVSSPVKEDIHIFTDQNSLSFDHAVASKGIVQEDGTSRQLLRPWWRLVAILKDEKLHPRVKANLVQTVESYTPLSEINRYERDEKSKFGYLHRRDEKSQANDPHERNEKSKASYDQMQKVKDEFNRKMQAAQPRSRFGWALLNEADPEADKKRREAKQRREAKERETTPSSSNGWISSGVKVLQGMLSLDQGPTSEAKQGSLPVMRENIRSATPAEIELYKNKEKLKATWKGVKDPEVKETDEVAKIKKLTDIHTLAHSFITGTNIQLKRVKTKETHKIVVDAYAIEDAKKKSILKRK